MSHHLRPCHGACRRRHGRVLDTQRSARSRPAAANYLSWARQDPRRPTSPKITQRKRTPQQANTFTDASVLLPRIPWTAYAGIGIVHIDRDLIADPIHTIEAELTETRSDPTRRYGTVNSAINNSTRMDCHVRSETHHDCHRQSGGRQEISKDQRRKEQTKPLDKSS